MKHQVKTITLLTWLTQLGLSVAVPPAGFLFLALWLRDQYDWGQWVVWAGIVLGVIGAIQGLVSSLQAMNRVAKEPAEEPPMSFNDHD